MPTIKTNYYTTLASYFQSKPLYLDEPIQKKPNTRKLVEQPWQQTKGEMWDEVTDTLCNLDFIQVKAYAKMTYELVNDFNEVLKIIPDNQETISEDKDKQARMDKYTQDLIAYAKGKIAISQLKIPKSITPWTEKQIDAEIERIKTSPTKADLLKDFLNFLGNENSNLQNYAKEFAFFTHQQAWNYAAEGPIGKAAGELQPAAGKSLLRLIPTTRPSWNPMPPAVKTLSGHTSWVNAVSITPDGKRALSGSNDKTCILWDLETGQVVKTLSGQTDTVSAVSITPDGKRALSGSWDNTCILWDLETGQAVKTLTGHTYPVEAVSITPDGKRALSGSWDKTCILWDMETGQAVKTLSGHTSAVSAVSITPDGKRALSG
ncbi:MAG: WD40 repeat domain-containing protein, partial [Bacteroidia bacterium]|nr:WD40 repeat domain-containing protein [Bacteroidia bacterium]